MSEKQMDSGIWAVSQEEVQKYKDMSIGGVDVRAPGRRRLETSQFTIEVIDVAREREFQRKNGESYREKVNIVHFNPRHPHVGPAYKEAVSKATDTVMRRMFRISPNHQDFCLEFVDTIIEGRPGLNSFCLMVTGAHYEPDVIDRLMKAAVTISELVDRSGVTAF